ncbi:MAG: TlpA family protein disulfide reductase [Verrucomicrobiales bacterium]|nr:TlpA family protein disulfide reductase [Verrucomicrobiales bacterium]
MPHLIEIHNKYKDRVVLIGVHSKSGGDKMAAFVKENKIPYPVAHDAEGKTQKAFVADSFPDYFVIDKKGVLRVADLANSELDKAIEAMLKEEG